MKDNRQNKALLITLRLLASLAITLIIILPSSKIPTGGKTGQNAALEEFTACLDRRIPAIMDDYSIPGVCIALISEGEIRWMEAYGYADLGEGRKMTTGTVCRVESISKPVTAWGVMKLIEQGTIDPDMPVAGYLKSWQFPEREHPLHKGEPVSRSCAQAGARLRFPLFQYRVQPA